MKTPSEILRKTKPAYDKDDKKQDNDKDDKKKKGRNSLLDFIAKHKTATK